MNHRSTSPGISPKQVAVLHVAKKQLGFDDNTYRAILMEFGNVTSSKELSPEGFEGVMRYFNAWGFRSDRMKRTFGNRPGMATPAQVDMIRDLWRKWSGSGDEAAMNHWLEHTTGFHRCAS
ncbi:phage gp16-like protein [Pseudochelatococcus lubricantis]|uniref:Phage gp16-like protein n=1 Tax=Pseudochelatococcus lubricantis TaxID=1538102 RepID=A0ABX0V7L6_9HYPH|nr:regulatory protein GemA [Pseudochelatococcus lubricantis]NIJ60084.1 phage gp16-like protein [Pseudochelatococcus lubricantis]